MDIYNIPNWTTSTVYEVDSVVLQNGLYYYAKARHTSGTFATDLTNNLWGGNTIINGQNKPLFIWTPSYNYRIPIRPIVRTIKFSDGYAQDIADNISNNLLTLNLTFEDRGLNEITAILHFLNTRKGFERFYFVPPAPYNLQKKFVCLEFESNQSNYDKYSVDCTFEERV